MFKLLVSVWIVVYGSVSLGLGNPPNESQVSFQDEPQSYFLQARDGISVHYTVKGTGVPVLLLHGYYGTGKANWYLNGIAQELAKTNKVITLDFRGHGESDKPKKAGFYGQNLWQDVIQVLDQLEIDKAHFHGFSMGGTVVAQILYHSPERALSATFGGSGIPEYSRSELLKIPQDRVITLRMSLEESRAVREIIRLTKPDVAALAVLGQNTPDQGERRHIDLKKIDIPVLAINGEFDAPNYKTYRMKRDLKNFRSVVIKNKAHASLITPGFMPRQYLQESVQFIRSID